MPEDRAPWWAQWVVASCFIPALYVMARLSLVLPGTALDGKPTLNWAWQLSCGNGWRLVLLVGLLPWLFTQVAVILLRHNATLVEVVLIAVLVHVLLIVEVAALSLSYKELASTPSTE